MRRNNPYVNDMIERFCEQWDGTTIGYEVKNMQDNETSYEYILERMGLDYEDYEDYEED